MRIVPLILVSALAFASSAFSSSALGQASGETERQAVRQLADTSLDLAYSPINQWENLEVPSGCKVKRIFANASGQEITFTISQMHFGEVVQFGFYGDGAPDPDNKLSLFGLPSLSGTFPDYPTPDALADRKGIVRTYIPELLSWVPKPKTAAQPNYVSGLRQLVLREDGQEDVRLASGHLIDAFEILNACLTEKLTRHHITDETEQSVVQAPKLINGGEWQHKLSETGLDTRLPPDTYLRVGLMLVIEPDGSASHCQSLSPATRKAFVDTTCDLFLRNGRFAPAEDSSGDTLPSLYMTSILFAPEG